MKPDYIVTCTKTGRYWQVTGIDAAYRMAQSLGLKDFTVEELT